MAKIPSRNPTAAGHKEKPTTIKTLYISTCLKTPQRNRNMAVDILITRHMHNYTSPKINNFTRIFKTKTKTKQKKLTKKPDIHPLTH